MKDALAIHRMLLERETLHEIVRLPRLIANADELPEALGVPASQCLVTRIYAFQGTPGRGPGWNAPLAAAVVVTAGSGPLDEAVRSALGARSAEPASANLINAVTDYAAELVAPLLLPDSMPILMDQRIVESVDADDVVYTTTGESSTALGIHALDLSVISGAKPVDLSLAAPCR